MRSPSAGTGSSATLRVTAASSPRGCPCPGRWSAPGRRRVPRRAWCQLGVRGTRRRAAARAARGGVGPVRHLLRDVRELVHDRRAPGRLAPIVTGAAIDAVYERSAFMQLAGLRLARERGLPHILEVNAPIEERRDHHGYPLYRIGVAREREKLALSDQVVCVTAALRRYLEDRGADPARVAVIPNAVRPESFRLADPERSALRARLGIAPGQVAVGFVGRFGYWRGMVPLLEAFALVAAAEPRAHFVLVGGGQLLPEVTRLVAERELESRVTLTGVLTPEAAPAHVAALDLGVLAGSPWYSSPIKLFEYGAAGLGIVAPRVPAVEEVIRDEDEGLLVTPEAPAAIAAAILRLIANPEERRALGAAFRERVQRRVHVDAGRHPDRGAVSRLAALEPPVTILMVNKFYYLRGGAERYAFDVTRLLERHGHRVIPLATRHPQNLPTPYASDFIPGSDFDAPGGPLGALAQAARVIYSPAARRAMAKALLDHRPDVVHLHNIAHHFSTSILDELGRAGVPVVQTVHDFEAPLSDVPHALPWRGVRALRRRQRRALRHPSLQSRLALAERGERRRERRRRGARRLPARAALPLPVQVPPHEAPHPRDRRRAPRPSPALRRSGAARRAERIRPAGWRERRPGREFALYAGRLAPEKGVRTLVAAARRIPEVPLKIAGEGPLAAELGRERARGGLDHVELLGALPGDALAGLWRSARFTVVPSECYENSPLVVLESFALGKPVVGSRLGGIAELVGEDGSAGRLVPPRDPEALAAAMAELWAEPAAAAAMGEAGRALIAARHTPEAHWAGLTAAYAAAGLPISVEGRAEDRPAHAGA